MSRRKMSFWASFPTRKTITVTTKDGRTVTFHAIKPRKIIKIALKKEA